MSITIYGANQYEWHIKNKRGIFHNINTDNTVLCDEIE